VVNNDDGTKIELEIRLSPREREVLLAGGILKFLRGA
jgi:type II secretory pathway component PulM